MRAVPIMVLSSLLAIVRLLDGQAIKPHCQMAPAALSIILPDTAFMWVPGGDFEGACGGVAPGGWTRGKSGAHDLWVHVDGPEGSGHYWKVVTAVSEEQQLAPAGGACMSTSTVGWRTLLRYGTGPLPWLDDVDGDGTAEFILWNSFPLHDRTSMAESALVGWAYRLVAPSSLVLHWTLSRVLAGSVAREYRSALDGASGVPGPLRAQAAEALEELAEQRCSVAPARPH